MTAGSALQKSVADPIVEMQNLSARITLTDGPATIVAPTGQFDPRTQGLEVPGQINFNGPRGYTLQTTGAKVDLKKRTMEGQGNVSGTLPQGNFTTNLFAGRVNYNFSRKLLTSALMQVNSAARISTINVRLRYIYRPNSDLFIIYNQTTGAGLERPSYSFQIKLTRDFTF